MLEVKLELVDKALAIWSPEFRMLSSLQQSLKEVEVGFSNF